MTMKDEICPTVKVDARLLGDGTLWIKTDKIADIGRVIVEDGKTRCKQFYQDAQPEPCEDAVSRADILSMIDDMADDVRDGFGFAYEQWKEQAEELPPVTPKQRTGKWVFKNDLAAIPTGYYECSECKIGRLMYKENFCPHCGLKMEGANKDVD